MSKTQLETEYKGMIDRYELYAKFGIAVEAAQLFETELGTLLLSIRGLEKGWHIEPDGVAARKILDSIERNTLGGVLNTLKRHIAIDDDLEQCFSSALKARNRLMHGFFERHNFKIQNGDGRREMIADLESLHGELFTAWQTVGRLTTSVLAVIRRGTPRNE